MSEYFGQHRENDWKLWLSKIPIPNVVITEKLWRVWENMLTKNQNLRLLLGKLMLYLRNIVICEV